MTQSSAPVAVQRPAGFTLDIPEVLQDLFLLPIKPLGTWSEKRGTWDDKATFVTDWQRRGRGFAIEHGATAYGIPAGKNHLLFVDIDTHKEDENGFENLQALVEEFGGGEPFDTYTFKTGSGARQMAFYCAPELQAQLKPSKGSTLPGVTLGVDIRVGSSYSIGPGSIATQPDNSIGYYTEETPGKGFTNIEDYPWFVELLKSRAAGTSKNPTLLARKAASAPQDTARTVTSTGPKLTNQKGEKAIAPVVTKLMADVAGGAGRHQATFTAALTAGRRGASQDAFKAAALAAIEADLATAGAASPWDGKPQDAITAQFDNGWKKGRAEAAEKAATADEFTAYVLSRTFVQLHPEYRWVTPRENPDTGIGWFKFDSDPASRECGIYKAMDQLVVRNEILDWLTAVVDAANDEGDTTRAEAARRARDSFTVDEVIRQIKGNYDARAYIEDFDVDTHRIVDMAGIRDLNTMEVAPHDPAFLATRKIYFRGDADIFAEHKDKVEKVMASCHPEDRAFLEAMLGTVLRQEQPLSKKGVIIYGPSKDNGKSSLVLLLLKVLGEKTSSPFGINAEHSIIHRNAENKYARADLDGKTLTVLDDLSASKDIDFEMLKRLIGSGSSLQTRQIGERTRSINLFHLFLLTCNRLPNFGRGEDVIDRFEVVLFCYKYAAADKFDANNPWHKPRDPFFVGEVTRNAAIHEAFYYYLLLLHKAWAESGSRIEVDTITDHIRANKEDWMGKTNTLHSIISEYGVRDENYFVTEKDLHAFITHMLKEQGQGVFGQQTLRTDLEVLTVFREWGVWSSSKRRRSTTTALKNLLQSKWHEPMTPPAKPAPDAANIFVGLRLKTDERGDLMTEDEWEIVVAGGERIRQAFESDPAKDLDPLGILVRDDAADIDF